MGSRNDMREWEGGRGEGGGRVYFRLIIATHTHTCTHTHTRTHTHAHTHTQRLPSPEDQELLREGTLEILQLPANPYSLQ